MLTQDLWGTPELRKEEPGSFLHLADWVGLMWIFPPAPCGLHTQPKEMTFPFPSVNTAINQHFTLSFPMTSHDSQGPKVPVLVAGELNAVCFVVLLADENQDLIYARHGTSLPHSHIPSPGE